MVISLETAKIGQLNNQNSSVVKFGTQSKNITTNISLNNLKADTVSFSGKKTEPYIQEAFLCQSTYVIPKGYKVTEPLKLNMSLEVCKNAELGDVECRNEATIKGKVDKLTLTFETLDTCMIRAGKEAKTRELNIGNNSRFAKKATVYLAIDNKALKDPENFQKILINNKEMSREAFIKFAQKPENELEFNNVTLKTPQSWLQAFRDIFAGK